MVLRVGSRTIKAVNLGMMGRCVCFLSFALSTDKKKFNLLLVAAMRDFALAQDDWSKTWPSNQNDRAFRM